MSRVETASFIVLFSLVKSMIGFFIFCIYTVHCLYFIGIYIAI